MRRVLKTSSEIDLASFSQVGVVFPVFVLERHASLNQNGEQPASFQLGGMKMAWYQNDSL